MGCDIHTRAEVRNPKTGSWETVTEEIFDYPYFSIERPISEYNKPFTVEPYMERNYDLFTFLAGVRSGGRGITPVAEPRGVPEDASEGWKQYVEEWGYDLHSTSYFTYAEILEMDPNQEFDQEGTISRAQYIVLKHKGVTPNSWCGWTSSPTMDDEAYEKLNDFQKMKLPSTQYIRTSWKRSLSGSLSDFFNSMQKLQNLIPEGGTASDVRLVFGFDN